MEAVRALPPLDPGEKPKKAFAPPWMLLKWPGLTDCLLIGLIWDDDDGDDADDDVQIYKTFFETFQFCQKKNGNFAILKDNKKVIFNLE